jgi:hypothetical protein
MELSVSLVDGKIVIAAAGGTLQFVPTTPPPVVVDPPPPPPDPTPEPEPNPQPDPTPPPTPTPGPTPSPKTGKGVWLDHDTLMDLPASGGAWGAVLKTANASTADGANVADMGSTHAQKTLAVALAGVRLSDAALIEKAKGALTDAIGTEDAGKWLDVGRNVGCYTITADVLGIRGGPVFDWLKQFSTRTLPHDNTGKPVTLRQTAWSSGSNASSQEGFVLTALAAYLGDRELLDECWKRFKRYCGDRTVDWTLTSNQFGDQWQTQNTAQGRVGILEAGATVGGMDVDGAVCNDLGRSNGPDGALEYKTESLYPWVGLDGAFCAAVVLHRQGYPAFETQDRALLRAIQWHKRMWTKYNEPRWWLPAKKKNVKWLAHVTYGLPLAEYPVTLPVDNHLVPWVDWTHPAGV